MVYVNEKNEGNLITVPVFFTSLTIKDEATKKVSS